MKECNRFQFTKETFLESLSLFNIWERDIALLTWLHLFLITLLLMCSQSDVPLYQAQWDPPHQRLQPCVHSVGQLSSAREGLIWEKLQFGCTKPDNGTTVAPQSKMILKRSCKNILLTNQGNAALRSRVNLKIHGEAQKKNSSSTQRGVTTNWSASLFKDLPSHELSIHCIHNWAPLLKCTQGQRCCT